MPILDGIVMSSILSRWMSGRIPHPDASLSSSIELMQTTCAPSPSGPFRAQQGGRTHLLAIVTDPERQRRTPVAVARHVPVARVGEPGLEATLSNGSGDPGAARASARNDESRATSVPASGLVVLDQVLGDSLDLDEPNGDDSVDERSVRAAGDQRISYASQAGERATRTASRKGTNARGSSRRSSDRSPSSA